ncbi:MAG: hypothetical protein WC998_03230 [Candidatus Paceibacterota bacterium]|jgi:hypothetical protein
MFKKLSFSGKLTFFVISFSVFFYWFHELSGYYNNKILLADVGGLPWLYASMGTLFSILAGFIIQKEWENWNNLIDSVKGEVEELRELWLWSQHFPKEIKDSLRNYIIDYLNVMIENGLNIGEKGERSESIEKNISNIRNLIFNISQDHPQLIGTTFIIFNKLIDKRNRRISSSSHHVPEAIKNTIFFSTILMISLSFFIGVKNLWLDYLFTLSVSLMTFVLYMVIEDINNPLLPGSWHLTTDDYKSLLSEISTNKN